MAPHTPSSTARSALVTGGAGGIGWAVCRELAMQGYRIVLADIDEAAAMRRVAELGACHHALTVDLLDAATAAALPAKAAELLGGLDVIVNNAGVTDSTGKSLIDLPETAFHRLVALNLTAVAEICASAQDILKPGSAIVNMASGAAYRPLALRGPYSATKAGITALTRALAHDLAPKGIAVTAIAPGYTLTPLVEELAREGRVDLDAVSATIPMGRIATPQDIATVAGYCAGTGGRLLSGETIVVDGGGLMGAPSANTAPTRGTSETGRIAVLDPDQRLGADLTPDMTTLASADDIAGQPDLSGVIDIAPAALMQNPAELLDHTRAVALACAENMARSHDFALLFMAAPDQSAAAAAGSAARAMLARTLALEWAPSGIRVNALEATGPLPDELLQLATFLVGPLAGFVTGQAIRAGVRS